MEGNWKSSTGAGTEQEYRFYQKDAINGRLSIYNGIETPIPAAYEEIAELERAAVWQGYNVEQRLVDHFNGRPNTIVEDFKNDAASRAMPK